MDEKLRRKPCGRLSCTYGMVEVRYDTEVTPGIIFFASTHRNTEGGSAGGNGDGVQSNYPFPPLYESTPLRLLVHAIPRQGYGSAKKKI